MTFFRILKYRKKFGGHGHFSVWMYQIARNVMIDALKKKARGPEYRDQSALHMVTDETGETELLENERSQMVHKALNALNDDQKEVLILSRFQNLKYREIGKILGCSEGTVKVRVFRALKNLKSKYMELEGVA